MLKVGLIGLGFMGRTHLKNYIRLESAGFPAKITAIFDIDKEKYKGKFKRGNIGDDGIDSFDFSGYTICESLEEMLEIKELDFIDINLPTHLHAEVSIKALNKGLNVLCEKPMALNSKECAKMIKVAQKNNKKLMIAQCLRFWPEYEYLKECVESQKFGKVTGAYFFRGGVTPVWTYQNWSMDVKKSGGCILDQHLHDVDMINWLFGKPRKVSTVANNVISGTGYDIVSTNYIYDDGKVVNAQNDWTLNGDYGFKMLYRVNFEKGNLIYEGGILKVNPNDGKAFMPELVDEMSYYREIKYFAECLLNNTEIETATAGSTKETIEIIEAEVISASKSGEPVEVVK